MEASTVLRPRPVHEERRDDTLTNLKREALAELNAALRARGMDEIIEWANPTECEPKSASLCLLGRTVGMKSSYMDMHKNDHNHPGGNCGIRIITPEGIEDIKLYEPSNLVLLVKMFDSGVLQRLEAV